MDDKIEPVDLTKVFNEIGKVRESIAALNIPDEVDLKPLMEKLQSIEKSLAIVKKENEVQDAELDEIKLKSNNPLAN